LNGIITQSKSIVVYTNVEAINVEAISRSRHAVRSKNNRNLSMSQPFPVIKRTYVEAVGFERHSHIASSIF